MQSKISILSMVGGKLPTSCQASAFRPIHHSVTRLCSAT
ncbi:hypothetical protein GGQ95_003280 [Anoxybacillus rupiensis]|nr:hypothetical protein [Anoxybacillus rupiensis]